MAYLGFTRLKNQIAKRGKVSNPAGVAYAVGVRKYGKEGMRRKAIAGRRRTH